MMSVCESGIQTTPDHLAALESSFATTAVKVPGMRSFGHVGHVRHDFPGQHIGVNMCTVISFVWVPDRSQRRRVERFGAGPRSDTSH